MTTSLDSLLTIADELLTAAELIRNQKLAALPHDTPAATAYARMAEEAYDVAPVTQVPIAQYVHREDLPPSSDQPIRVFARNIGEDELIPEEMPLSATLQVLHSRPFSFVHHRRHITGVITRADIGQPPVGLLAFGMITSLENALDQMIERERADDSWLELMPATRRARIDSIYQQRQAANTELGWINCLNLDDRLGLALKLGLGPQLGFESNNSLRTWKERVREIRDTLAHGDTLLNAVPDPVEALDAMMLIRETASKAWGAAGSDRPSQHSTGPCASV